MILSYDQIIALIGKTPEVDRLTKEDLRRVMKEVERLTQDETRERICDKLDNWIHGIQG